MMNGKIGSDIRENRVDPALLSNAAAALSDRLVELMHPDGFWEGRLSSSALSTATAVSAFALAADESDADRLRAGAAWLVEHRNSDGGWGDTVDSPSNLATTLLAVAALKIATNAGASHVCLENAAKEAEEYLKRRDAGDPRAIVQALQREYGGDRTFAIPILMNCALAGLVAWSEIPGLPFELAVFPRRWYKFLRLHVVSYALPALIAIGLLLDRRNPPRNIARRWFRAAVEGRVLEILQNIQPAGGGFLEAVPLTSFVTMGLLPLYGRDHPVAKNCLHFLRGLQRLDGSWPIDSNLSVWVTTSAATALGIAEQIHKIDRERLAAWIGNRQYGSPHPYTDAAPGGWGWTHLPGSVPDADDTAGALLALGELNELVRFRQHVDRGAQWLLNLQNGDGGWPTFCRGWGKLPFDKSSPDLTAHALRALAVADPETFNRSHLAICKGLKYLHDTQQSDGSWLPLWFGNQAAPGRANPVIGTSLTLRSLELFDPQDTHTARGWEYLLHVQNADGGWGGAKAVASSLEETSLAVAALTPWAESSGVRSALSRGAEYLLRKIDANANHPSPLGLYFSHLWYSERLYPLIWTVEALGRLLKSDAFASDRCTS